MSTVVWHRWHGIPLKYLQFFIEDSMLASTCQFVMDPCKDNQEHIINVPPQIHKIKKSGPNYASSAGPTKNQWRPPFWSDSERESLIYAKQIFFAFFAAANESCMSILRRFIVCLLLAGWYSISLQIFAKEEINWIILCTKRFPLSICFYG